MHNALCECGESTNICGCMVSMKRVYMYDFYELRMYIGWSYEAKMYTIMWQADVCGYR